MIVGQATLSRNYSGTVVIRVDHQLITHGIYRFTRNPIYLGLIMVVTGLPVYVASLYGFLTSLILFPIILNRIKLEEKLLSEEFQDAYQKYKETTKKLIPFIYWDENLHIPGMQSGQWRRNGEDSLTQFTPGANKKNLKMGISRVSTGANLWLGDPGRNRTSQPNV